MMRLGKYELGRTLGEGSYGKVKFARNTKSGQAFAIKIIEKHTIMDEQLTDRIKREIATLKLLKHPNIVRLHEVLASKSKIYMVLEYVSGGELFDRVVSNVRLSEAEARKYFQQLMDGLSYCHHQGVFHRDLKVENILIDSQGNVKISDFGLAAQNIRADGLLHTSCGSPNYVAPEVLAGKGYEGNIADVWSSGVVLYIMLTGRFPFDDKNLAVLCHKITKGDFYIPNWLSPGSVNLLRRILDPNPDTRITISDIMSNQWFNQDYIQSIPNDEEEDTFVDDQAFSMQEEESVGVPFSLTANAKHSMSINAFQLIGMSSFLDLSGFFEEEDVSHRKIRFTSHLSAKDLLQRIEGIVREMGFRVVVKNAKLKASRMKSLGTNLSVVAEVIEISPSLNVVEFRKSYGDSLLYRHLCKRLSVDLGDPQTHRMLTTKPS